MIDVSVGDDDLFDLEIVFFDQSKDVFVLVVGRWSTSLIIDIRVNVTVII